MGSTVLNATAGPGGIAASLDPSVRAYAHCGLPPSSSAVVAAEKPMGLVLINLNSTASKRVELPGVTAGRAWLLTVGAGGFFGSGVLLNGVPLPTAITTGEVIETIPASPSGVPVAAGGPVTLPPFSVCFVASECTAAAPASLV